MRKIWGTHLRTVHEWISKIHQVEICLVKYFTAFSSSVPFQLGCPYLSLESCICFPFFFVGQINHDFLLADKPEIQDFLVLVFYNRVHTLVQTGQKSIIVLKMTHLTCTFLSALCMVLHVHFWMDQDLVGPYER